MLRRFLSLFASSLGAACLIAAGTAHAADTVAGRYGEMLLAVQGDNVTGTFTSSRGVDGATGLSAFSCAFLLQGRLSGGHADISTWTPGSKDVIAGELTVAPPLATLRLRDQQPGCGMAAGDMVGEDYTMTRDMVGADWMEARMVAAKQAVLHQAPRRDARLVPYLVRYDAVVVLTQRPGWVQVRYLDGDKPVTGWLQTTDLVPQTWPRPR
jgi:hypothetical protein